jgi:hypothetical protein
MNIEKMQFQGQLAELKKKFKNLDTEASGLLILVRSLLNPYEEDLSKLDTEKALISLGRLNKIVLELKSLKQKIEKMEDEID